MSCLFQSDAVYLELRQDDTLGSASFDAYFREVLVEEYLLEFRSWVECHLDNFCLTIGIRREVDNLRAGCACCDIIFTVTDDVRYVETLDEIPAFFAVTVYCIIDGTLVVLLEDSQP